MQLLKKIGFYVFVVFSISITIWGYFKLKESKQPNVNVLEHVSNKAFCVIQTNNYPELITQLVRQNLIWNNFIENNDFKQGQKNALYLDSVISQNKEFKDILSNNNLYLSCYNTKPFSYVLQFKLKEKNNSDYFEHFFKSNLSVDESISSFKCYTKLSGNQKWFICLVDGIFYISNSVSTLQGNIQLKKEESIAENINYKTLLKVNGSQNSTVFYNHSISQILNTAIFNTASLVVPSFNLNQISFAGYSLIDSSSVFKNTNTQKEELSYFFNTLPNNPISITALTVNFENSDCAKNQTNNWKILNDSALYDIKTEFLKTLNNSVCYANYAINNVPENISLINTNDIKKNELLFDLIKDSVFVKDGFKCFKIINRYNQLFSFVNMKQGFHYVCIFNETLCFFNSIDALSFFITHTASGNTLSKNNSFMNYASNNLAINCNYLYYENVNQLVLNKQPSVIATQHLKLKKIPFTHVSIIGIYTQNVMQVQMNLAAETIKTDSLNTQNYLWTFITDSIIKSNMSIFTNHITQEKEILFQDNENNLQLITSTGILLWKKKINESIQSPFYTVDLFKNGKNQLLFNTKNHIHLIDRNGNYVQGYPLKTPSTITSNITLYDYEKSKDYRIFIACANKLIYNYTLYGVKTEGFVPYKTTDEVKLPIYYCNIGLSDYLITADVSGKLYAFSRKGLGRIDFKNNTLQNLNNLMITEGSNLDNTKIIYVDDKNNLLCKISLADKKEILKLGDDIANFNTSFVYLNDDSQKDIMCYGNGALYGYDVFSKKLIEHFSASSNYKSIEVVNLTSKKVIITYDEISKKAELINVLTHNVEKQFTSITQKPLVVNLYSNGKYYLLLSEYNKIHCVEIN